MICKPLFAILALLVSVGTADARSVNPKHLDAIEPPVEYHLAHDVSIQGYNILYTLRAGKYFLRYQDRRGQYFTGEGECMHLDIRTPKMTGTNDWTCGIFVPKDPKRGATFFRIRPVTPTHTEMGPMVNAIIRYGYGSFDWPDKAESMELREKLVPVAINQTDCAMGYAVYRQKFSRGEGIAGMCKDRRVTVIIVAAEVLPVLREDA